MKGRAWTAAEDAILKEERDARLYGWAGRVAERTGRTNQAVHHRVEHLEDSERLAVVEEPVRFLPWNLVIIPVEEHLARINERGGFPILEEICGRMTGRRVTAEGREWRVAA